MQRKPLPLPSTENQQIREYVDAFERGVKTLFVYHIGNGWYVGRPKSARSKKVFKNEQDALAQAEKIARSNNYRADILVFNQDGTITAIDIKSTPTV